MKKLFIAFLFLPAFLQAQTTGHMVASVSKAIQISEGNQMSFGNLSVTTAGVVVLTPQDTRTMTGGVSAKDNNFSSNVMILKGSPNSTFSLILPSSSTITDGRTLLTVSGFTSDLTDNKGTLDGNGQSVLHIGATLTLNDATTTGNYVGVYTLNAVYN